MPRQNIVSREQRETAIKSMPAIMRALCLATDNAVKELLGSSYVLIEAAEKDGRLLSALEGAKIVGDNKPVFVSNDGFNVEARMQQVHETAVLHPSQINSANSMRRALINVISDDEKKQAVDFMQKMTRKPSDADLLLRGIYGWDMVLIRWQGFNDSRSLYNLSYNLVGGPGQAHFQDDKRLLKAYLLLQSVYGIPSRLEALLTTFEASFYDRDSAKANLEMLEAALDSVVDYSTDQDIRDVFGAQAVDTLVSYAQTLRENVESWSDPLKQTIDIIAPLFRPRYRFRQQLDALIEKNHVPDKQQLNALIRQRYVKEILCKAHVSQSEAQSMLHHNVEQYLTRELDLRVMSSRSQEFAVSQAYRVKQSLKLDANFDGLNNEQKGELTEKNLAGDSTDNQTLTKQYYQAVYRLKNQLAFYTGTAGRRHISADRQARVAMLTCLVNTFLEKGDLSLADAQTLLGTMQQIQVQHQRDHRWYHRTNRLGDAMRFGFEGLPKLRVRGLSAEVKGQLEAELAAKNIQVLRQRNDFPLGFRHGMPCGTVSVIDSPYRRILRAGLVVRATDDFRSRRASGPPTPRDNSPHRDGVGRSLATDLSAQGTFSQQGVHRAEQASSEQPTAATAATAS